MTRTRVVATTLTQRERKANHTIADEWTDVVIVCRCGWRCAGRTKGEALRQYRNHRDAEPMELPLVPIPGGNS